MRTRVTPARGVDTYDVTILQYVYSNDNTYKNHSNDDDDNNNSNITATYHKCQRG